MKNIVFLLTLLPLFAYGETWKTSITPYLWLPDIKGELYLDDPDSGEGTVPSNYLDKLDMALMLTLETRKGKWSFLSDLIYLDFSDKTTLERSNREIDTSLQGLVLNLSAGYNLFNQRGHVMDITLGARFLSIEAELEGDLIDDRSKDKDILDAIIGIRGKYAFNDRWYMPYYFDIGTGDSDTTMQAVLSLGYQFDWGDILLGYRHLEYDQGNDQLLKDFQFSGPILGAKFQF